MLQKRTAVLVLLISLFLSSIAISQPRRLKGIVVEKGTQTTLPGAHIFLNNTTVGTYTNNLGYFEIDKIPPGEHVVVVSMIGYKKFTYDLDRLLKLGDFLQLELDIDEVLMNEIVVREKRPKQWLRNLQVFESQFLGITDNALRTELLNPEVLDFENRGNDLYATSRKPLEIENRALGYKVIFHLEKFTFKKDGLTSRLRTSGYSVYEELEPIDENEMNRWQAARLEAYNGSFLHFIHAMLSDKLEEEGFEVFYANDLRLPPESGPSEQRRVRRPISNIFNYTSTLTSISLFNTKTDFIRVHYTREGTEDAVLNAFNVNSSQRGSRLAEQYSWISFPSGKAIVNIKNGKENKNYRSLLHGYWGLTHRVADLLPDNYKTRL